MVNNTKIKKWFLIKGASLVAQLIKNPPAMREIWVWSLDWEHHLEKGKATHSSILAWRISRTVHEVKESRTRLSNFHFHSLNKDQMRTSSLTQWHHQLNGHEFEWTLGDGEGQGSLACFSPWGHKELGTTEWLNNKWGHSEKHVLKVKLITLFLRLQFLTHESFKRT